MTVAVHALVVYHHIIIYYVNLITPMVKFIRHVDCNTINVIDCYPRAITRTSCIYRTMYLSYNSIPGVPTTKKIDTTKN